jgi:hydroxymethylpyrimidine pyrophosphatase-like HAD family hydrolase
MESMRFLALATDYDGTLAHDGEVSRLMVEALRRLRASGRKTILVTGRELPELLWIFPEAELFDLVVAENGALLYSPTDQHTEVLAEAPPARFLMALRERGVFPLSIGRVTIASHESQGPAVLDAIHTLGLDLQVIYNKGSVMILPSGVNKATGLAVALTHLGLAPEQVVGIGDAENDHPLLRFCGCGVAVANALPALKERADIVTHGEEDEGVIELIDGILADDLAAVCPER